MPGLISSSPAMAALQPFISFSTSCHKRSNENVTFWRSRTVVSFTFSQQLDLHEVRRLRPPFRR
jgi:hypothetical protein